MQVVIPAQPGFVVETGIMNYPVIGWLVQVKFEILTVTPVTIAGVINVEGPVKLVEIGGSSWDLHDA
jgi:F420-0:gamma-glutamyl ligase-like protein